VEFPKKNDDVVALITERERVLVISMMKNEGLA
jgi:hypothetical protein